MLGRAAANMLKTAAVFAVGGAGIFGLSAELSAGSAENDGAEENARNSFAVESGKGAPPGGEDIVALNWPHLMSLFEKNTWTDYTGKEQYISPFIFRGMSDSDWMPDTSLQRLGRSAGHNLERLRSVEHGIIRSFQNYCANDALPRGSSVLEWLALAQHHGCPTRILDFSYSPLVALFFATQDESKDDVDGVVWCVHTRNSLMASEEYSRQHAAWRDATGGDYWAVARVNQLESLLCCRPYYNYRQRQAQDEHGINPKQWFDALAALGDSLVFVEPPHIHPRVRAQHHVFALATSPGRNIGDWLKAHQGTYRRIIIPAAKKKEFREKLRILGVNHWTIFPDLTGLSEFLRVYYSTAGSTGADIS